MISDNANSGSYACFDSDQTTYQWDLEESIFAYLEMKNVLTREKLDPTLKLSPFLDTDEHEESLFSYYQRLCTTIDDVVCYMWIAQAFSGMTLQELKFYVDEMLQSNTGNTTIKTILTTSSNNSIIQTEYDAPIPNFYKAQQELYNRLMANGIEVFVVTASNEELIRMVVADPKYGYNVKPQNVIGIATLLKDNTQLTVSRKQIEDNTYDQMQNLNLKLTSYLWSPQSMFVGKYGAILTYINQWKMPVLVAGDTPTSDGYMMFHAYNQQRGTIRLWVNRKDAYLTLIKQMKNQYASEQEQNDLPVTADKNWIYVTPNDLGPENGMLSNITSKQKEVLEDKIRYLFSVSRTYAK
ncbi:unnamed protein product [Adineta steineri]|uniref:Phosphorylcholine phosphatase n=1 Tax=Adineta steineri TaxID=433720 RepID=A0A814RZJ3_9BILA|nr:unnamed protein product [Adineta steineri]CAF4113038.1 unnamed protein product [Adineta steineri]